VANFTAPSKKRHILLNIFTSGKYSDISGKPACAMPDNMIRYILMNFVFVFGTLVLAGFFVHNVLKGSVFDATLCAVMIVISIIGFIIARLDISPIVPAVFAMICYELTCSLLTWNGDAQGSDYLFIYIYPLLTVFLLGMKAGACLACSQLLITGIQVCVPGISKFAYHLDVSIRIIAAYILVLSIAMVFERTLQVKDRLNNALTEELRQFNDNLQKMVEEKTNNLMKLHDTFGRYLPDRVIRQIMESPNGPCLGGEKRCISIMTADIRGFTSLAEKFEGESVVKLLNHYFSAMVEIIHSFNGTIIEFLGDAILCIFGAPMDDEWHADNATACALKMQSVMKEVNVWSKHNGFPNIEMGIAINSGEAIVGNIGSDKVMKYNVIGNNVNLSSRIECYTTGGQVMLSEYTYNALRVSVNVVQKARVIPKGVSAPIFIMQVDAIGEPYSITLDREFVPLKQLERPIRALCYRINDKQIEEKEYKVLVTHLSRKEGKLLVLYDEDESHREPTGIFNIFDGLKLLLFEREVLAKINSIEDNKTIRISFTTDPNDILVRAAQSSPLEAINPRG
jgi:class 3 adenylate cyclase